MRASIIAKQTALIVIDIHLVVEQFCRIRFGKRFENLTNRETEQEKKNNLSWDNTKPAIWTFTTITSSIL